MCYENEKYEKGEEENIPKSKNPDDEERKVDPGIVTNTEEPQGIHICSHASEKVLQLESQMIGQRA